MIEVAGTKRALAVRLSDAEAVELAALAQAGNAEARDTLAHSLLGLALSIAGAYTRRCQGLVEEAELQGVAFETLLHFGIDRYSPVAGVPVRTWVALVIRRKLALALEQAQRRVVRQARYVDAAGTQETHQQTTVESMQLDLRRMLQWALKVGLLTEQQAGVMMLRGQGLQFDEIGERLGIHHKKASREYSAALTVIERRL